MPEGCLELVADSLEPQFPRPEETRHPVILASGDHIKRLIIDDIHKRVLHAGVDHTLSELRYRFWASEARATVNRILQSCIPCRNRRARPRQPEMGDLHPVTDLMRHAHS